MQKPTHPGLGQLVVVGWVVRAEKANGWGQVELCLDVCGHRRFAFRVELSGNCRRAAAGGRDRRRVKAGLRRLLRSSVGQSGMLSLYPFTGSRWPGGRCGAGSGGRAGVESSLRRLQLARRLGSASPRASKPEIRRLAITRGAAGALAVEWAAVRRVRRGVRAGTALAASSSCSQ